MNRWIPTLAATALLTLAGAQSAAAAPVTTDFAGTITSTMSVNDGTNTGSIPSGTAYTGTVTYDDIQTPAPAAYGGGTHTVYAFSDLAFTIGTSTAHSGPGRIDVYDNLTTSTSYPTGDSIYVNFAGVAPSGLLAGAQFNWMGLALLDRTGVAVSGGRLPAVIDGTQFGTRFSEFNFGTRGTPWGAGNTSMIQSLTTVGSTVTPPPPPPPAPIAFSASLPNGTVGVAYSASFPAATGGTGAFTYTATGLPAGLSLAGTTVSGTPTTAGSYPVTITATDEAGASASTQLTITVAAPPAPSGNYTIRDESKGKITAIAPDRSYIMVGTKKLIWDASTFIIVNTPGGELHVIDTFVKVGMRVQWKGLRDKATNTVLTSQLEVN